MRIVSFDVRNYKSFSQQGASGTLSPGINVVVGQNNAGKTALLEGLTLRVKNIQHRSLRTHPIADAVVTDRPTATIDVAISNNEMLALIADNGGRCALPSPNGSTSIAIEALTQASTPELIVRISQSEPEGIKGLLPTYKREGAHAHLAVRRPSLKPEASRESGAELGSLLANVLAGRMYLFGAERFRVGEADFGHGHILQPNAQNLPEVLNRLQSNPDLHRHFVALVRRVLPQVQWISVEPQQNKRLRVLVWSIDPSSRRSDLAVPLDQSGTGVGQVLAILYVVVLSPESQVIAIDEPQSFLHPGAVRALIEILHEHSQHQFVIITTHSPVALTAANPQTIVHLRTAGGVSTVSELHAGQEKDLRFLLADLGVRIEDVFGFDNLIWVEGATEELCFPLIVKKLCDRPSARTGIFGLVATGDLEGRHRDLAFDVYERLSEGSALMPPAIAFIFDRETRTDQGMAEMAGRGNGKVFFLPLRMYENYLLDSEAIVAVASSIVGFGEINRHTVEGWLDQHRWDPSLFRPQRLPTERTDEAWKALVSGGSVLKRLFADLSEARVSYDKLRHGRALTEWLLENRPVALRPVADLLGDRLPLS